MAYAAAPVEPKRRPTIVTVACWLLFAVAVCQVMYAIVVLSQLGATKAAFTKAFAGTQLAGAEDMMVAITGATTVGRSLLFAVGYTVLGVLNGRGKNPARVVTWAVAVLSICCSGSDLASNAIAATSFGGNASAGGPSSQQIQQTLREHLPGWYQPALTTTNLISIAAILAAVVLLALPIANEFFRKTREPGWEPPVPSVPPPTA